MSTTSSLATTSTTASPTADPAPSHGASTSANYFFGFLITFIALLLIFVGCGIGSRRGFRVRGGTNTSAWDEALQRARTVEKQTKPKLWEMWLKHGDAQEGWTWRKIMPISVTVLRGAPHPRAIEEEHTSIEPATTIAPTVSIGGLRSRPFRSFLPSRKQTATPNEPTGPPEAIQIAVIVAMPSPARINMSSVMEGSSSSRQPPEQLGEYQIGVMSLPWDDREVLQ